MIQVHILGLLSLILIVLGGVAVNDVVHPYHGAIGRRVIRKWLAFWLALSGGKWYE